MRRRDISKALFATATGSAVVTQRVEAQTCGAPCYPQTLAEIAAKVPPANCAYAPLDCRRYGATTSDSTGATNTSAINNALLVASNNPGGGVATLPGGNFNINGAIVGYTNTYLQGQGMGMGGGTSPPNEGPDMAFGGTSITQMSGSADVVDFANASCCGLMDLSLWVGAGGNGVVWSVTSVPLGCSYFKLQNVSVNLAANSAGIGVYLNNVSTALYFPRLYNVTVTGGNETGYGTKVGIQIGNPSGVSTIVYGGFNDLLVTACQIGINLQTADNNKFSGVTLYNLGNNGIGINGVAAGNNLIYGLLAETGTISKYVINWSSTSSDNQIFMMDVALPATLVDDLGINNQYYGDDGSNGFTNKFGPALNLYSVRRIVVGDNAVPAGTPMTLYYSQAVTVNPGAMAAGSTNDTIVSVGGMVETDKVLATAAGAPPAGIMWSATAVSGGFEIRLANITSGSITPASQTYNVSVFR